jgi:hypothetical protein
MADGYTGKATSEAADDPGRERGQGLFQTRDRWFVLTASGAALLIVATIGLNFSPWWGWTIVPEPFLVSFDHWMYLAAASSVVILPLLLLLLDPPDNMAIGPRLALPVVTLAVLAGLAGFSAALNAFPHSDAALVAFMVLLATVFIARGWNAGLFARYAHTLRLERDAQLAKETAQGDRESKTLYRSLAARELEQGNAEAISSVIATAAVLLVGGFAYVAGGWDSNTRIGGQFGLAIAGGVIGLFAIVILVDWLAELPAIRGLGRIINGASHHLAPLARFYNAIDTLLVRIGAHAAGAGHANAVARYGVLAGTQLCLLIMAWFLPDPAGLIPAFISFTLAVSVSRLWAWVEEDRNLALITQFNPKAPRKIGFKEDYRDEALLGFVFVLFLMPIALKQVDAGKLFALDYFDKGSEVVTSDWFVYFSLELAKALPIVDWADIYLRPENFDTIKPIDPWGQHATFAARALLDLVLVAALFQAISITLRTRQQKALYAAGQINRLDELIEREELRKAVSRPPERWFSEGVDFRRYSEARLRELHSTTSDDLRKRFIEAIFSQKGAAVGYAMEVLEQLAKRRARVEELLKTFSTVRAEHESGEHPVQPMDFEGVFDELRAVQGLKALKQAMLDFAEQIGAVEERGSPTDLADLLEKVIFDQRRDQFAYTRIHAAKALTRIVPRLVEPDRVSTLLAKLKAARSEIFGASIVVPELLEAALVERLREIGPPGIGSRQ